MSRLPARFVTRLADRRILRLFRDYLAYGAYPFYREGVADYPVKLIEVVRQMIDSDLAVIYNIDKDHLNKLNRILELICRSHPLELKVTKLAGAAGINIRTLCAYLGYLEKGSLVRAVTSHKSLAKVDERYLFEAGGKGKDFGQISGITDSFVLRDNEEYGVGNKIPVWLLGFLY